MKKLKCDYFFNLSIQSLKCLFFWQILSIPIISAKILPYTILLYEGRIFISLCEGLVSVH